MHSEIIKEDGRQSVTVFLDNGRILLARDDSNPNFDTILDKVKAREVVGLEELFDIMKRFERLSERITARNGLLYLDNDPISNELTNHIARLWETQAEDIKPMVLFLEKVYANPSKESREQLMKWLAKDEFTVAEDGDIVAYKYVLKDSVHGYKSDNATGKAIVNGEPFEGHIPNPVGGVVEMPRSEVNANPSVGCSVGLHVGTWDYVKSHGDAKLEIHINPRDVVSVPNEHSHQKVRCCRYRIIGEITDRHSTPVKKHPSQAEMDALVAEAKARKKGVKAIAPKDWKYLEGAEPKDRTSWVIP